jgi:hypothetical protein
MKCFAARHSLSAVALLSMLACAAPEIDDTPPDVAQLEQALFSERGTQFWPDGVVPICFSRRPDVDLVEPTLSTWTDEKWERFDAIAAQQRKLIEATFETLPNVKIDFTGWGHCSNEELGGLPGTLRLVIQIDKPPETAGPSGAVFRHCEPGHTGRPFDCSSAPGYSATNEPMVFVHDRYHPPFGGDESNAVTLHEIGHALGFRHELDRDDNRVGDPRCPDGGRTEDLFTRYDPDSIMSATYCHMNPGLSELDKLGLEVVYPRELTAPFRGEHSFAVAQGLVMREDDHLVTDWLARGADLQAFEGTPRWSVGGITWTSWRLPATYVTAASVELEYDDFRRRAHQSTRNVAVDDAQHAALVVTII